jgi:glycosyltransferase involved in cell wall biosynthesis
MEICIESQPLHHHQRSGLFTYVEGLVESLHQADNSNRYTLAYYSLNRGSSEMPGPLDDHFRKVVLKVPDRPFWGRQGIVDNIALPILFRSKKIKVFHRPAGYTMPNVKNIFKVLTVHDLRTLTMKDQILKQDIGQYRKALQSLDICTVVSECTKRDLITHFQMDEKKIRVTYLGADARFRPVEAAIVAEVNKKYHLDEPYFLSVGSVPRKNVDGILKAFAAAKCNQKFLLAICCNWEYKKYQDLAKELSIENRVRFLDKPKDDEVVSLYSGCRAFVFPSLYEGFGLPILEAMQCGAAVITSNTSSCPEVAGNAAITLDPQAVGEITSAIDELASNEGLRQGLIEKGFQRAKLFSWAKFAKEMRAIYEMA